MADVETRNNKAENRYEALVEGVVAGFSAYQLTDLLVVFTHTEVDDAYEGQGLASKLVAGTLDDVRRLGQKFEVTCEYVLGFLEKHPEYQDLLADQA